MLGLNMIVSFFVKVKLNEFNFLMPEFLLQTFRGSVNRVMEIKVPVQV